MLELNMFWPVYKSLENDVLKLADTLFFSDDQLNIYSLHIANLLIRCSIENEAISNKIYKK